MFAYYKLLRARRNQCSRRILVVVFFFFSSRGALKRSPALIQQCGMRPGCWAQWKQNKTNYSDKWGGRQVCQHEGRMLHLPKAGPFGTADGYSNFLFCEERGGGRGTRHTPDKLSVTSWLNKSWTWRELAKLDSADRYSHLPGPALWRPAADSHA